MSQNEHILSQHISHWRAIQSTILNGNMEHMVNKNYRYYCYKLGTVNKLFVFLTALVPDEYLLNPQYFQWGQFSQEFLDRHHCMFLRDVNNFYYLHTSSIQLQRLETICLIEYHRMNINIPRENVIIVGCSAGATAAIDISALGQYGKCVAFSSQTDFEMDLDLLGKYDETYRPRFEIEKNIIQLGYYPNLLPSFHLSSAESRFFLIWGQYNKIDNEIHTDFQNRLHNYKNVFFIPVNTDDHNSAGNCDRLSIKQLLTEG